MIQIERYALQWTEGVKFRELIFGPCSTLTVGV
jgi:hypothetical protein